MSSEPPKDAVIQVEGLGKRYLLGHRREERYQTLRESLTRGARNFGRRLFHPLLASSGQPLPTAETTEEFWALRDIAFAVARGERIGIIGRNGAGKSTLLKILSRITEPTAGRVRIRGRVASLLEVGTGFHPELTGRENIYLNGAILGMSKGEIRRKFDEIVAFAEVERFLDTPVKRYSSGMYVRLAFAVAAHLEPEILIVDEVLAVGDAQFQKKCLGKMEDVGREGRTVLFVSHNMGAIRQLCTSALLLAGGRLVVAGAVEATINRYLQSARELTVGTGALAVNEEQGVSLTYIRVVNGSGEPVAALETGKEGGIEFGVRCDTTWKNCQVAITIDSFEEMRICALHNVVGGYPVVLSPPFSSLRCTIPRVPFFPGRYRLTFKLKVSDTVLFYLPQAFELEVEDGDFFDTGRLPEKSWGGVVLVDHRWSTAIDSHWTETGI